MKLKNRTSAVPIDRTIMRIESALISAGATGISKEYDDGMLKAINFQVKEGSRVLVVRLPARVEAVQHIMLGQKKRFRKGTKEKVEMQANRTAWKLVQDWVEVQVSMIAMGQAEFLQVFLPYIWDGHRTLFDTWKESKYKALPGKCKETP